MNIEIKIMSLEKGSKLILNLIRFNVDMNIIDMMFIYEFIFNLGGNIMGLANI